MLSTEEITKIAKDNYNDIFMFCKRMVRDEHIAEDITQDVFLLLQKKATELFNINIKAWLINSAKNYIKHYFEENKKYIIEELQEYHISVDDIAECLNQENNISLEEIEKLKQIVLNTLTEQERDLFRRFYMENQKQSDIAKELNLSENTIAVYCMRLRVKIKKLAKELTPVWTLLIANLIFNDF